VLDDVSKAKPQQVRFFVGLDEPLMHAFGGERIAKLMDQLGMGADEVIQHPMVDRSIVRAQQKLQKAAPNAVPTRSPEEWFASNLPRRS
jgi:preprotein translocase subunit SecA